MIQTNNPYDLVNQRHRFRSPYEDYSHFLGECLAACLLGSNGCAGFSGYRLAITTRHTVAKLVRHIEE